MNGQSNDFIDTILNDIYLYEFNRATNKIETIESKKLKDILKQLVKSVKQNDSDSLTNKVYLDNDLGDKFFELINYTSNAINKAHKTNTKSIGFEELNKVLIISRSKKIIPLRKIILIEILKIYLIEKTPNSDRFLNYLDELNSISNTLEEKTIGLYFETNYQALSIYSEDTFFKVAKNLKNNYIKSNLSNEWQSKIIDILLAYFRLEKQVDNLELYAKKLLTIPKNSKSKKSDFNAYLELAALEAIKKNKTKALEYLELSNALIDPNDSSQYLYSYYRFGAMNVYKPLNEHIDAYEFLEKSNFYEAELNFKQNKENINQLKVELDTAETENQLIISNSERSRNQNIAIGLVGLLLLGSIIAILIHRNTKRKQRIAEQEREIEIQKTEKILKEQEITSINAMIEGQEKERQRVASDLHDSVGATLAAAKLQFNHISKNKDKALEMAELFDKTEQLLADAYTEVRSMAHVKNSGVIAKNGLLPAINKLANNVSINGSLKVTVQDFGLENRLENSLEITLFRVIQELITNIVKHANATEASINITQHAALLSIIIEDNGKGFHISEVLKNPNGMGLSSIEKRIEHLEGTMEVDSSINKGTTILIDIPIK